MAARGLIISATGSGAGKTIITSALIRVLARRGYAVSSFKVGPDYIDGSYHAAASGRASHNIDLWAMRPATARAAFRRCTDGVDLVIGEGAMGLFDASLSGEGSTADVARFLDLPVVLVIDVSGQAQSVAATVAGFRAHRPDIDMAGVILNRTAGDTHRMMLARALEGVATVFGHVDRDDLLVVAHRHLGLVQAHDGDPGIIDHAATRIASGVDVDSMIALARPIAVVDDADPVPLAPPGQRVAVACDCAFSFLYASLTQAWRDAGAEILPFSPLGDEPPDATADAVYLPGGYPELHAGRLAAGQTFLAGLRRAADRGCVIYGECGGYMVLGQQLTDMEGHTHAMAGLLPVTVSMHAPRRHLGYRRMVLASNGPLGKAGSIWRGHEFHYACETSSAAPPLFFASDANGRDLGASGAVNGKVAASFMHIIDCEEGPAS